MKRRVLLFLGAAACAQPAFAQQAAPEIVVTAPLEGSRSESLQGATILNRETIVENLNGGLGETLAKMPGVSSTFFGAGASRPVIRGLGDDRVRILENGIGAIDAASASPDHAVTADGLDAKRIEVLRGAAALAYGGNAIGGVINVIDDGIPTKKPDRPLSGSVLAAFTDSNDGREASASVTADAAPVLLHFEAAGRETDNYSIPGFARSRIARATDPLPAGIAEPSGEAPNSWSSVRSYGAGASAVRDWGFAGLALKRYESNYGLPPEEPGSLIGGQIRMNQNRIESRGDVKINFGPFKRIDWGAQYSDYTHSEIEDTGAIATTFTNEGYEARLEAHNDALFEKLKGAVGIQFSKTDFAATGEESFISPTITRDYGAFTVQRWDHGLYGFEGGLRLEQRTLDNQIAGDKNFTTLSGSAGAFVRSAPNWFTGITFARSERAPTAIESFAFGPHLATGSFEVGNAALDKETALSIEGSVRFESATRSFEMNVYHIDYSDYIALVPTGQQFVESLDAFVEPALAPPGETTLPVFAFTPRDATFTGGEIAASSELFEVGAFTFTGDVGLDMVRASFKSGGALPRIPPRTLRLGLAAESEHFKGRFEVADVADQDRTAPFETQTDGYAEINARLTWRPQGAEGPISIMLDGRNLTDAEERVHASFLKDELPRPGRTVRIAVLGRF
ncbi:MAG: TonB-dependent receptor [Caulobacterales bacterium]